MTIYDYHVRLVCDEPDPFEYYREIQTDVIDNTIECPAHPGGAVRDFTIVKKLLTKPTCKKNDPTNLDIKTNVGSAIVNDIYAVTADPTDKKFIKMSILRDTGTSVLEIAAFEKTTGEYGSIPAGKILEMDLKEFSVIAAGTTLVLETSWI